MVYYANPVNCGTHHVASIGDGYSINLSWFQAYPFNPANSIAYHIYYSTIEDDVFSEGVKFIIIDGYCLTANIIDLTPGQLYYFCSRPVEYDPTIFDLSLLPIANDNLRFYPSSMLRQNISATDIVIPLLDVESFPPTGVIKIGIELIQYLAVDSVNNNLLCLGSTPGIGAHFIIQSNDQYYLPNPDNIGTGTINSLLITGTVPTETWTIRCIFVEHDVISGLPILGTAKFIAIGSISGAPVDQYGNTIYWQVNQDPVSNGLISFSITELTQFNQGDEFTAQVQGITPGTSGGRGFNFTPDTIHTTSGYDGYHTYSPIVSVFTIEEDNRWDNIFLCECRFEYPNFPFTILDGYHQTTKDILSTDLSAADAANIGFPMYDYAGWHRTDPVQLMTGVCVGSYIGGEMGCIDGYGNYSIYRGFSLQDQNTQRQDMLLSMTGRPACLIQRVQTGITCNCYLTTSEYQDDRCPFCFGTKFVLGYQQYFDPRHSDGRIRVRTGPTAENLRMYEAGLESEYPLDIWTLTVPTIKTRDIIVLFDQDNNEEFRYEVSDVIRNNTIVGLDGGQHLKTFRIRKFDPSYQVSVFHDTKYFPISTQTSLGFALGIPPHSHTIHQNENDPSTWSQLTEVSQGHNHEVLNINGILTIQPTLSHIHQIIIPPPYIP